MTEEPMNEELHSDPTARRTLVATIIAVTAASIAFRFMIATNLNHTALVFMGIPALLALVLVGIEPKTSAGSVNKAIAIALCMSGIVFGEAFICILMASPIFFCIGALTANIAKARKRTLGLILVPLSLEGVTPALDLSRDEIVEVQSEVVASPEGVRRALAAPMRFDAALPFFFRLGFPTPGAASGAGLAVGDRRSIEFLHGHHPGKLVWEITSASGDSIVFTAVSDDSYITHWLAWRRAVVRIERLANGNSMVTWTLSYRRRLDPSWYFKPLERYGVGLAGKYLLSTLTTPRVSEVK
jgi:hypothetical protein